MWLWLILGFAVALLQGFFMAPFAIYGLAPNLAVIIVAVAAQRLKLSRQTVWLAFWIGLWLDIASQQFFGLRTLFLLLFVAVIWVFQRLGLELKNMLSRLSIVFFGALGYGLTVYLAMWIEMNNIFINEQVIWFWLAPAFSTLIFACIGWPLIKLGVNVVKKRRGI